MGRMTEKSSVFTSPNVPKGGVTTYKGGPERGVEGGGTSGSPKGIKFQMTARDRNYGLKPARWKLSSVRSDVCCEMFIAQGMKRADSLEVRHMIRISGCINGSQRPDEK